MLRSFSVQLFVSFIFVPGDMSPARCLAFVSFWAFIYVKYIVFLVISYAITHVSR